MKIFLIGFMGSGKSTLAKKLSKTFDLPHIDLDSEIEFRNGRTIPSIFEEDGEALFRILEKEALENVLKENDGVISCGGGTPCFFNNLENIKKSGVVVYLKLTAGALKNRILNSKQSRPLTDKLSETELSSYIKNKLEERIEYYSKAHIKYDGHNLNAKNYNELVNEIKSLL